MKEIRPKMEQNKMIKMIIWGILIILVVGLSFYSFGYRLTKLGGSGTGENSLSGIPAECQLPAGQDLPSWKEHLGHHQETKYCLQYF